MVMGHADPSLPGHGGPDDYLDLSGVCQSSEDHTKQGILLLVHQQRSVVSYAGHHHQLGALGAIMGAFSSHLCLSPPDRPFLQPSSHGA